MDRTTLRGGRVIDPSQGIDGPFDLTIEGDRIVSLEPAGTVRCRPAGASRTSRDLLVTPGLIDLHGHWYEGSPYGLDPKANLLGGVTTAVDAGSAGLLELRRVPPAHDRDRPGPGHRLRPRRRRGPGHDRGR